MKTTLLLSLLLLGGLVPASAAAVPVEVQGALGVADCTRDYCDDGTLIFEETSPGLGLMGSVWVRPHRVLGIGGGLHGTFVSTDDQPGVDALTTFLNLDVGLRGHVPLEIPLDPYAGLTFGWSWTSTSYDSDLDEGSVSLSGPTLGLAVGADWAVADAVAIGGLFKWYVPFWSQYCYDSDSLGDDCDDPDDALDDGELPDVWFLGATVTWRPAAS